MHNTGRLCAHVVAREPKAIVTRASADPKCCDRMSPPKALGVLKRMVWQHQRPCDRTGYRLTQPRHGHTVQGYLLAAGESTRFRDAC